MTLRGSCDCNNIEIIWHNRDGEIAPRACQCNYCSAKAAAYVTQAGTKIEAVIHNSQFYTTVKHGSMRAVFHECSFCDQVIFVTANIDGSEYSALNANHLNNKQEFSLPLKLNFSKQSAEQKHDRWRQNWCHPVVIYLLDQGSHA